MPAGAWQEAIIVSDDMSLPAHTEILPDADSVASRACEIISQFAAGAIEARGMFRLVLAGGNTPQRTYQRLAQTKQEWQHWHIFWGDERCLPPDHPDRNSHQDWLANAGIPDQQIHPIPAELGADAAAAAYTQTLQKHRPFDCVVLGMGEDGHTASLFPGHASVNDRKALVIGVHNAPKPPSERVSLTPNTLQQCHRQLVLVTGQSKAAALQQWQAGVSLPIAQVVQPAACLLMDEASQGGVLHG
jgi:6-phosphogluconolactonase